MVRGPQAGMGLLSWLVAPSWSSGQPEQPLAHLFTIHGGQPEPVLGAGSALPRPGHPAPHLFDG